MTTLGRRFFSLSSSLLLSALVACGGSSDSDASSPSAGSAGAAGAAGSSDPGDVPDNGACKTTQSFKFVMHSVQLPGMMDSYATDVDGDGNAENGLQLLSVGAAMVGLDPDGSMERLSASGNAAILVEVAVSDVMNGCGTVKLNSAAPPGAPPKFDGSDTFSPNQGPVTVLSAQIKDGVLTTTSPKNIPAATAPLQLSIMTAQDIPLPVTIYGTHLKVKISPDGFEGELHGVFRQKDMNEQMTPALAKVVSKRIHGAPDAMWAKAAMGYFEDTQAGPSKAKCDADPTKCCATNPKTCEISADEIVQSSAYAKFTAPDVQMFGGGGYSPKPGGSAKDAQSIGFGVKAVKAAF